MIRHFTATAYVIHPDGRALLLWHVKLKKWMPPGGHVDENELPEDAAVRECKEETGVDIELVGGDEKDFYAGNRHEGRMMRMPYAMLLEEIPAFEGNNEKPAQPAHQHMDFIYVGRPKDPDQELVRADGEAEKLRWLTKAEIEAIPEGDMHSNVRNILLSAAGNA